MKRFLVFTTTIVLSLLLFLPTGKPDLAADRAALLALRSAVGGRSLLWNLSEPNPCSWPGVLCESGRVTVLRLPGMGLSGQVPANTIANLTRLHTLSLRYNALSGLLPSDFAAVSDLRNLYLQENLFSGPIPDFLFSLNNLVRLNLASNNFSGQISPAFNNLTRLGTLYLENNKLTGSIPDLNLPSLSQFNVSNNQLTGSVPSSLTHHAVSEFAGNSLCGGPLISCNGTSSGSKNKLSGGAIAGIIIGSVIGFLLIVGILIFLCRRKSSKKVDSKEAAAVNHTEIEIPGRKSAGDADSLSTGYPAMAAATAKKADVNVSATKGLVLFGKSERAFVLEDLLRASAEVLGKGTFGTAYKAVLEMGMAVAVKRLKDVTMPEKEFREKIEAVGAMNHEGLVPLRAYRNLEMEMEMEMVPENEMKNETSADSPTSVLEDEETCKEKVGVNLEDKVLLDAKNGDSTLLSRAMAEEEEKLLVARVKEEERAHESEEAPHLNDSQFTKLDELLTQTQLYSEFLLEKMDDITSNGLEEDNESVKGKKRGRGSKRKAATHYNNRKATRAVAAMLTRFREGAAPEDMNLTDEERVDKEQAELVPLLTGGKLKPYQIKGVKWLISLWQNGLNGILADQMGLGKTIQTIGFLAHLKGKGLDGPYLVIAPLSTLSNWVNEVSRFVPSVNAIIYHGNRKERDEIRRKHMPRTISPKFPIVVTSYEVALNDARKHLRHYNWKYLVVDEGHRLKNSQCKLLKELKWLPVENKLLLTGTPLQNNLAELWSLLNFILPDIFSSHEEFESWFDLSGKCNNEAMKEELEERRKAQVVAKLHAILRPFLLRRMKTDVEQMLPRKKEIILYANLTEHQKSFQDHLVNKTLENYLREKVDTGRGMKGKLNNLMIQLRKNCNHPDLLEAAFDGSYFYPPVEQIVEQCGKFRLLDRLLAKLFARNHKVLIFSQWTKILDIIDYYFSEKGFEVCRIDGNVKLAERKRQIQEFNDVNSNYRIFILSTRAGGLGINLTAADTCILYDSDWNPQMDLQAMDRCHRIGQTKPVHVYRLATAQSVEGRILKRAFSKLKLEHVVIGKGQFQQERTKPTDGMEEEELLALLRNEEDAEDKMIQTDLSDEDLERVLDRSDLIAGPLNEDGKPDFTVSLLPLKGPGWEVVIPTASGGMLSTLSS